MKHRATNFKKYSYQEVKVKIFYERAKSIFYFTVILMKYKNVV